MGTSRVKELFANRFEPDGDSYLFRSSLKAPGIRVSAAERERFITAFNRQMTMLTWGGGLLFAVVLVGVILVAFQADPNAAAPDYLIYSALAVFFVIWMALYYWFWGAPVRALQGRKPVDDGRSKSEAKRVALQRVTWGRLFGGLAAFTVAFLGLAARHNLLVGWYRLWLLFGGLVLVMASVTAFRKWRAEARE
jgi:hypothetical protein